MHFLILKGSQTNVTTFPYKYPAFSLVERKLTIAHLKVYPCQLFKFPVSVSDKKSTHKSYPCWYLTSHIIFNDMPAIFVHTPGECCHIQWKSTVNIVQSEPRYDNDHPIVAAEIFPNQKHLPRPVNIPVNVLVIFIFIRPYYIWLG